MRTKKRSLASGVLGLVLLAAACHKKPSSATAAAAPGSHGDVDR